jgi:hypothetical protein
MLADYAGERERKLYRSFVNHTTVRGLFKFCFAHTMGKTANSSLPQAQKLNKCQYALPGSTCQSAVWGKVLCEYTHIPMALI